MKAGTNRPFNLKQLLWPTQCTFEAREKNRFTIFTELTSEDLLKSSPEVSFGLTPVGEILNVGISLYDFDLSTPYCALRNNGLTVNFDPSKIFIEFVNSNTGICIASLTGTISEWEAKVWSKALKSQSDLETTSSPGKIVAQCVEKVCTPAADILGCMCIKPANLELSIYQIEPTTSKRSPLSVLANQS